MTAKFRAKLEYLSAPLIGIPAGLVLFVLLQMWAQPIPLSSYFREADLRDVSAGSIVTVKWQAQRTAPCHSIVYRTLIGPDGRLVFFEPQRITRKGTGVEEGQYSFAIPEFAISGVVHYRVRTEFFCNWVQEALGGSILPLPDMDFNYSMKDQL